MAYSTRIPAPEAAEQLQGWSAREDGLAITRRFEFTDFKEAFSWMTRVALEAERLDHHPEWFNVYRTVDVTLTTHDAGGTTDLDVALARYMDSCAA